MDRRKIFVAGITLAIIIILIIVVYLFSRESVKTEIPPVPEKAAELPAGSSVPLKPVSPEEKEVAKETFEKYATGAPQAEIGKKGYTQTRVKDKNNKVIPLDNFTQSVGATIYPKIRSLLKDDDYYLVNCGKNNFGLIVNVRLFDNYSNLYQDEKTWMKEWGKEMLKDTHSVIFPGIVFNKENLDQKIEFKEGKYRYADILLPDGSKGSLNYNIVFDSIIITGSLECMDKVSADYLTLEP